MTRTPDRGWTEADVPNLAGRRYLVTGSNTGLGLETARVLAYRGGAVVICCRNTGKGDAARSRILAGAPSADVTVRALDLASLASVRAFADAEHATGLPVHGLINNAGIMAIPAMKTADGFEMQLGTNHLGHFALTALLFPRIASTPGGRVVTLSSTAHRVGTIAGFEDPFFERKGYSRWGAYGQSKLANLLFMLELDRRVRKAGSPVLSLGAHPGYAATELQARGAQLGAPAIEGWLMALGNSTVAQSAASGAWPTERAATDPEAESGDYYGPTPPLEMWGRARRVQPSAAAKDPAAAARLWEWSERVTGIPFVV